jgi:hypothetical protein
MRFIFKFICVCFVFLSLNASAQTSYPFPIGSPQSCVNLPNHGAIQDCQIRQKAEYKDWQKQMKNRSESPSRSDGANPKLPMNCFKRESTGEQVCAN